MLTTPLSGMLPRLVDGFEAITVRVKDIGSVVTWIVVQPRAWRAIVVASGRHGGSVERVDLGLTVRHEADMDRATVGLAGPEPEEHAAVSTKAFQVRMARRPVLAVVSATWVIPSGARARL